MTSASGVCTCSNLRGGARCVSAAPVRRPAEFSDIGSRDYIPNADLAVRTYLPCIVSLQHRLINTGDSVNHSNKTGLDRPGISENYPRTTSHRFCVSAEMLFFSHLLLFPQASACYYVELSPLRPTVMRSLDHGHVEAFSFHIFLFLSPEAQSVGLYDCFCLLASRSAALALASLSISSLSLIASSPAPLIPFLR